MQKFYINMFLLVRFLSLVLFFLGLRYFLIVNVILELMKYIYKDKKLDRNYTNDMV